jgi:chromosome segregation ATPase
VLHAAGLGALLFFAPVREIVFHRKVAQEAQVITRGDELEEVVDRIRDRTVEHLRERVALLESGQDRMARNFATINEHFQPFEAEQRATARARMEKYIAEVLPRQKELADLLAKAQQDGAPSAPISYSQEWMSRILTAQEEIQRGIRLLELGGEELLAQQEAAEDAQFDVTQFIRWLAGDLGSIGWQSKRLAELEQRRVDENEKVERAAKEIRDCKLAVATIENTMPQWEAGYNEARVSRDRDRIRNAKEDLDRVRRDLRDAKRRLDGAERDHKRAMDQLPRTDADIAKTRENLRKAQAKRDEHLVAGCNVQRGAYERQKAVVERVHQLWAAAAEPKGGE